MWTTDQIFSSKQGVWQGCHISPYCTEQRTTNIRPSRISCLYNVFCLRICSALIHVSCINFTSECCTLLQAWPSVQTHAHTVRAYMAAHCSPDVVHILDHSFLCNSEVQCKCTYFCSYKYSLAVNLGQTGPRVNFGTNLALNDNVTHISNLLLLGDFMLRVLSDLCGWFRYLPTLFGNIDEY